MKNTNRAMRAVILMIPLTCFAFDLKLKNSGTEFCFDYFPFTSRESKMEEVCSFQSSDLKGRSEEKNPVKVKILAYSLNDILSQGKDAVAMNIPNDKLSFEDNKEITFESINFENPSQDGQNSEKTEYKVTFLAPLKAITRGTITPDIIAFCQPSESKIDWLFILVDLRDGCPRYRILKKENPTRTALMKQIRIAKKSNRSLK